MITQITVEVVTGGFILSYSATVRRSRGDTHPGFEREVYPTRRKLQHRINELLNIVESGEGAE